MITLEEFFMRAQGELTNDRPVILGLIMAKSGSAPRGIGAHMLIMSDRRTVDTIGGGPLEYLAIEEGQENLLTGTSVIKDVCLNDTEAGELGMVCGGRLTVLLQYLGPQDLPQIIRSLELLRSEGELVLEVQWQQNKFELKVWSAHEDFPQKDKLVKKSYLQRSEDDSSGMYLEIFKPNPTVYLFGGGHVSQAVAKLLAEVDFPYIIVEERPGFGEQDAFKYAKDVVIAPYKQLEQWITMPRPCDYVLIMTHAYEKDIEVLDKLLALPTAFVGAIGSRHKQAFVRKVLTNKGYSKELIDKIVMPLGLDISAQTPAEIGISIVAQLIKLRAQHQQLQHEQKES